MKIKTRELSGIKLDYAVAKAVGGTDFHTDGITWAFELGLRSRVLTPGWKLMSFCPSRDWADGGPLIAEHNITLIRADDDYAVDAEGFTTNRRIPQWWGECDRWIGHNLYTSWEGEHMDPSFIIRDDLGLYGTTPLEAAMRALVNHKLGAEVEIPKDLK